MAVILLFPTRCWRRGYGWNVNATGRRNASTVFIMLVSGLILYLVYGVGARDLGERLEAKERRQRRLKKLTALGSHAGKTQPVQKAHNPP